SIDGVSTVGLGRSLMKHEQRWPGALISAFCAARS
ncbi:MAG: hypothetical protein ACI8UD_004054, partial [Planctomycetota bacterium]